MDNLGTVRSEYEAARERVTWLMNLATFGTEEQAKAARDELAGRTPPGSTPKPPPVSQETRDRWDRELAARKAAFELRREAERCPHCRHSPLDDHDETDY